MSAEGVHPPREELFAYRDGELPAEKRMLVEAHVVGCGACRALIDEVSGLESALRRAETEPGELYYEGLPDTVLRRIGGEAGGDAARGEDRADARARGERREGAGMREGRRVGRAPRVPWAAVFSTATAAAVVAVVVVLARQGAVRRAMRPLPPPASDRQAATTPESVAVLSRAPRAAPTPTAARSDGKVNGKEEEPMQVMAQREADLAKDRPQVAASLPAPAPRPTTLGSAADQRMGAASAAEASEAYAALLRRFALPAVWNERVSSEALSRAEQELRFIYQTGRAGRDSARVRLYLAEATRLRYQAGGDSALLEEVSHHYWRAIRLAGVDTVVAKTARQRLGTLGP